MANVKRLATLQNIDKTEDIYPITSTAAVYANNGQTAESILQKIESTLQRALKQDNININGIFTSTIAYSPINAYNYATRESPVSWGPNDITGINRESIWIPENHIILIIPCTDGSKYFCYQKVIDNEHLLPITYWISESLSGPDIGEGAPLVSGQIYCVIE